MPGVPVGNRRADKGKLGVKEAIHNRERDPTRRSRHRCAGDRLAAQTLGLEGGDTGRADRFPARDRLSVPDFMDRVLRAAYALRPDRPGYGRHAQSRFGVRQFQRRFPSLLEA